MNKDQNKILVVDDEPDMCWALKHVLEKNGYLSRVLLTGEEAVNCLRKEDFSLVFLDAKLSDMEGLDLAVRIREISPLARIVIVSGYFYKDDKDILEAMEKGLISGFISKPFTHKEIIKTVRELLKGGQAS